MKRHIHRYLLLISLTTALAKEDDLPLCPSNMQYFPQNLPMHCRMPNSDDFSLPELPHMPTMPPLPPFFQNQQADKPPNGLPPPPFPGMAMRGPMGMPRSMPMPGPMPIPMMPGVPPHKLPVIVMPFYSPDPSHKKPGTRRPGHNGKIKKKPFFYKNTRYDSDEASSDNDSDTGTSSDTSDTSDGSSDRGYWKGHKAGIRKGSRRFARKHRSKRKNKKRKELLTPILQYVTKDGYVIFEKKISKGEAKDWLKPNNEAPSGTAGDHIDVEPDMGNEEIPDHDVPKTDAQDLDFKEFKDKSNEVKKESSTQKYRTKKHHRARKPNLLMNTLTKPGSQ